MWEGITFNNLTNHIQRVNMTGYHAAQSVESRTISGSFCNLTFLKYLNLKSVGVRGTIPSCLGNLSHLNYLWLKNNSLIGVVPTEIRQLGNLSYNQLTGVLPPCLKSLRFLKLLGLSYKKFNDSLQLSVLSSLEQLCACNFSSNKHMTSSHLTLPSSIKILWLSSITISDTLFENLAQLNFLVVSSCVLNMRPSWFPQFQLGGIDISSCSIGGRIPKWLFTQYSLQRLTLANDNLVRELPSLLWDNSPQLHLFSLSGNHSHRSLTIPIRSARWITLLEVSRNDLSGQMLSAWPPDLQLLMVNENSLTGHIPLSLYNLTHLEKLDLSKNNLNGNIPSCFVNYKVIQVLNLGDNSLEGNLPQGYAPPL